MSLLKPFSVVNQNKSENNTKIIKPNDAVKAASSNHCKRNILIVAGVILGIAIALIGGGSSAAIASAEAPALIAVGAIIIAAGLAIGVTKIARTILALRKKPAEAKRAPPCPPPEKNSAKRATDAKQSTMAPPLEINSRPDKKESEQPVIVSPPLNSATKAAVAEETPQNKIFEIPAFGILNLSVTSAPLYFKI